MSNSQNALETLIDGLSFAEAPRWHEGRLWISDFHTHHVLAIDESGNVEVMANVPHQPSGIGFLPDGDALIVSMKDRRLLRRGAGGELSGHADLSELAPWHLNDMVVDAQGRAWVGNFGFDLMHGAPIKGTVLIRVDPDGAAVVVADGLRFPNGMVITPDGGTLIVAETFGQQLTAYDIGADGSLSNQRAWARLGSDLQTNDRRAFVKAAEFMPDGICMDAEGAIWAADARNRRVLRLAEGGEVRDEISTGDTSVFACMLGGHDGKTLFMCTAPNSSERDRKDTRNAAIKTTRVNVPHGGLP